jgi:hypothetical protein
MSEEIKPRNRELDKGSAALATLSMLAGTLLMAMEDPAVLIAALTWLKSSESFLETGGALVAILGLFYAAFTRTRNETRVHP